MTSPGTPLAAAVVLSLFGLVGSWVLSRRFPDARFMRAGYSLVGVGGIVFIVWSFTRILAIGVAGAILMAIGSIVGAIGAFRKELRETL